MRSKNKHMKIINKDHETKLIYEYKINKTEVQRKNKAQTVNKLYMATMPPELVEFVGFENRNIYFYEDGNKVIINRDVPLDKFYQVVKLQKTNQFSIPKKLFNPAEFDFVRLVLDLRAVDFKGRQGLLSMELF